MDQKKHGKRPQKLDTQGARSMVFTLAISATIGFWAIFSKVDGNQFSGGEVPAQAADEIPSMEADGAAAFDLPPIPTLIPTLEPLVLAPVAANGLPAPVTISATIPTQPLVKPPVIDKSSGRPDKDPKERKQKERGGDKTTSSRSS